MKTLPKEVRDYLHTLGLDANASDEAARAFAAEKGVKIVEAETEDGITQDQLRSIYAAAAKFNCVPEIDKMIREGAKADACLDFILTQKANATPIATAEIGLNENEKREFSFVRAALALREGNWKLAPFEKEVSDATAKQMRQAAKGFCVPMDVLAYRTGQVVGTNGNGGYTVATDLLSGSFIDLLKNKLVLHRLGMTVLSGLVGNIAIPRATGGLTYYYVGEQSNATLSTATFDQVAMTPKTAAGKSIISRQLLLQSSLSIEMYMRNLLAETIAEGIENACLNGTGSNAQPTGLLAISGTNSVAIDTNGGALTGDHIVKFETEVCDDKVIDDGTMAYLTNARVRGKLKRTQEFSSTNGVPLWKTLPGDRGVGDLNGYPAFASGLIPNNGTKGTGTALSAMVFGKWSDAILALWGGLDITVDPYSGSDNGDTKLVGFQEFDFNVKHKESFCVCTDITTA